MIGFTAFVWSLLRLGVAATLFFFCASHWWATKARADFDALPVYNFSVAAEAQRNAGNFGEALLIVDAGLDAASGEMQAELFTLKARIQTERDDVLRRLREVARGALTGRGDSPEALTGAVAADLLVVGDVRDLVIQGARALRGEDADEVIFALSAAGLATTLAPEVDAGVAILKFARRVGALGDAFAKNLLRLVRRAVETRSGDELAQVANDAVRLTKAARPAGALKILKLVDDPATLHRVAGFAGRPGGAFALWLGRERSLNWLKSAGPEGEEWLLRAARKGDAGIDLLIRKGRLLFRPHPLLGLIKSVYKGNIPALLLALFESQADALFGVVAGWLSFELLFLGFRVQRFRRRTTNPAPAK